MDENELDLNLDELDRIEANADSKLQVKNRFQSLANKVRDEAKQKEDAIKAKEAAEQKTAEMEREMQFLDKFSEVSNKYPNATAYRDQIKEKVKSGYDLEDAALAILG